MKKKGIIAVIAALAISIPALAVFNEKDLGQTISVLKFELKSEYDKLTAREERLNSRNDGRRRQMITLMKKCNELSLMLYSQNQDFTFDHSYALGEVTKQYESFSKTRLPFDDMVAKLDLEIDRHERLIESLRRLPPALEEIEEVPDSIVREIGGPSFQTRRMPRRPSAAQMPQMDSARRAEFEKERRTFVLDSLGQADRDSCIYYALSMLKMYKAQREKVVRDSEHYTAMNERLKSSYDYAQNKYRLIQKRIFVEGQDDYFTVLKGFGAYSRRAWQDAVQKYSTTGEKSEWRGPIVVGFIFFVLFYLLIAIVVSNLVVRITMHKVKFFQTEEFQQRRHIMILLIGAFVFAISVMIARLCVHQNFIVEASIPLLIFAWLLIAILASLLIRLDPDALKSSLKLYTPVIIMGLIVISFRIIFIPNRLLNLIYPPVLLGFAIWQLVICIKAGEKVRRSDKIYAWITLLVMIASTILSWTGFVLMAVQIFIWWLFQLAAIGTITAVYDLLDIYEEKFLFSKFESTATANI